MSSKKKTKSGSTGPNHSNVSKSIRNSVITKSPFPPKTQSGTDISSSCYSPKTIMSSLSVPPAQENLSIAQNYLPQALATPINTSLWLFLPKPEPTKLKIRLTAKWKKGEKDTTAHPLVKSASSSSTISICQKKKLLEPSLH